MIESHSKRETVLSRVPCRDVSPVPVESSMADITFIGSVEVNILPLTFY